MTREQLATITRTELGRLWLRSFVRQVWRDMPEDQRGRLLTARPTHGAKPALDIAVEADARGQMRWRITASVDLFVWRTGELADYRTDKALAGLSLLGPLRGERRKLSVIGIEVFKHAIADRGDA